MNSSSPQSLTLTGGASGNPSRPKSCSWQKAKQVCQAKDGQERARHKLTLRLSSTQKSKKQTRPFILYSQTAPWWEMGLSELVLPKLVGTIKGLFYALCEF